ncbi:hypothetical protein AC578_9507 [Pseudocercospora eumusae]|nr:hypothetical protein AC578_9507 [Pseudocercospora eumusae]
MHNRRPHRRDVHRKCTSHHPPPPPSSHTNNPLHPKVIGPLMYSPSQAPLYHKGLLSSLSMFILVAILSGFICMYLNLLNLHHARRREELGKPRDLVDRSMLKVRGEEVLDEVEGDLALHDTTDLKNEDFIYVL